MYSPFGTSLNIAHMSAANPNYCQGTNKLFHRAILASGSSLAHSATVRDPVEVTRQVETLCQLCINIAIIIPS